MPRCEIAWACGSSSPSFLRNLHTVLHSGCINLCSYQKRRTVPFSPHSVQNLVVVQIIFNFFSWCIIDLQYLPDFWCTTMWISIPAIWASLSPSPPSHLSKSSPRTELSSLCSIAASYKLLLLLNHFSHVRLCVTPQTAAHQAPPSVGFSRQEYWSGVPLPSLSYKLSIFIQVSVCISMLLAQFMPPSPSPTACLFLPCLKIDSEVYISLF